MRTLFLVLGLMFVVPAYGQEPTDKPVVATEPVVAPVDQPIPEVPAKVVVEGDKVTVGDIVTDAGEVLEAFKAYKDSKGASDKLAVRLGLMALLAAIFKILLSCLKFTSEFWKGSKGKVALRISTLVLGIAVALTSHLAMGESWMSALMLGISGPLAISFHELFDLIMPLFKKTAPVK